MKRIVSFLLLALLIFGGFFGYKYYSETYVGVTAYALIPENVPDKIPTKDNSGKIKQGLYSYRYTLTFAKENGDTQKMEYELIGEAPMPLNPNSFVTAKISKNRIIEAPTAINEASVPKAALKQLIN